MESTLGDFYYHLWGRCERALSQFILGRIKELDVKLAHIFAVYEQAPSVLRKEALVGVLTWHRAIFPWGNPQSIFAATTFHLTEFGMGSEWFHHANDTRNGFHPQDCIAIVVFSIHEVKPSVGSHALAADITALPPNAD